MAQAIFKSRFIDFEPFKDGKFVESEMGLIPEGWNVKNLLECADYLNGLAMQKFRPSQGEQGIPVLKIKELRQGKIDEASEFCSETIPTEYLVRDGDVIFSWSGSLLVDVWTGGLCGLNQHLFKVTSKKHNKWFYYYWTKYHLLKFQEIARDKATTMGHIRREDLKSSLVLIPDELTYEKINPILSFLIEKQISNSIENKNLVKIRDLLLPKLMSGEIDVSQVKI